MKSNPSTNNKRYLFALLCCAGFMGSFPLGIQASTTESYTIQQQTHTVLGLVKDAKGEPVIGASVRVKGSNTGSITDLDGRFKISVLGGG